MTVFKPNKKDILNTYIGVLILALILASGIWLYTYNLKATASRSISEAEVELQRTRVNNSEIKNELYALLNPDEISSLAKERGLVKDANPQFVQAVARR